MSMVVATSPPTLTDAPLPNRTPLALTRNTLPFAVRLPRITDGSGPVTRFNATEPLPGCRNCTDSPEPMLKPSQLMIRLAVDWVIVVTVPVLEMSPTPEITTPPTGPAA